MTKLQFEELLCKFKESKMALKSFLKAEGVTYSTFKYWNDKKKEEETPQLPLAPIEFRESGNTTETPQTFCGVDVPGVTLLFPSGIRAHFGYGSEKMLMDVLTKIMSHVLPELQF